MECVHQLLVTDQDTVVCQKCGVERSILVNTPTFHTHMRTAPLTRFYSRPDRWLTLLRKVVGIHSGPSSHDPMWDHLRKFDKFATVDELKTAMRKSNLANKHYPCIHQFARCFCSNYKVPKPNPDIVLKQLTVYFEHILKLHHRTNKSESFFSYNWLLEQGLHLFNFTEYLPYIKLLKCQTRRANYVSALIKLYTSKDETHAENGGCEQPNNRQPSELLPVETPQSLSLRRQRPDEALRALALRGQTRPQTFSAAELSQINKLLSTQGMSPSFY